jgi:hypothetical protein
VAVDSGSLQVLTQAATGEGQKSVTKGVPLNALGCVLPLVQPETQLMKAIA